MTLRQLSLVFCFSCAFFTANAQLPNGSIAPNVTFSDLNGNTHDLYDILDQGKSVIFDVMATWCGPCWNYHNSNVLKTIYNTYGPTGTNEVEVFMIEASPSTTAPCLNGPTGCTGGTIGDWVTGTDYPIVHIESGNEPNFNSKYSIPGYPTLYKICPNRKIYRINVTGTQIWVDWITSCSLEGEATVTNSICFNDGQGGVDLDVNGGLGTKTYSWDNGATTQDLNNVAPGFYNCTITEGQGHSIEVGPFEVQGATSPIQINVDLVVDLDCFGDNTGQIMTTSSGGSPGYQYQWNNGNQTPNLSNVAGGAYSLSVTDDLGCEESIEVQITEPPLLTLSGISNSDNCGQMDGTISLFANGGTGTYLYDIGQGPQGDNVFFNLAAGDYVATVTDQNFCSIDHPVTVDEVPSPIAEAGPGAAVDCITTAVQLDGDGSTTGSDIAINWTTVDGNISAGGNTLEPTVDLPGKYYISITNTNSGCISMDSVVVTGDNAVPTADAGNDGTIDCNNNTYLLDGGASSNGSNFSYQWKNSNGAVVGTEVTYEAAVSDTYELVVTDSNNGCTSIATAEVMENLATPDVAAGDDQILDCINTNVTLDGMTSIASPSYEWKNAAGNVISTDATVVVNDPDEYTLVITDASNGCSAEDLVVVDENTVLPIADAGPGSTINCNIPQVEIGGNSSTGNTISYSWLDDNNAEVGTEQTYSTTEAGNFTLIVSDAANGCSNSSSTIVNIDIEIPLTQAGADKTLTCLETTVVLDGDGSDSGSQYDYQWTNDNGDVVGTEIEFSTSETGQYTLSIFNTNNGCSSTDLAEVFQNIDTPVADAGPNGQIDCNTAVIELNGAGSSTGSDISYVWRNGSGNLISNDINVEVASAGTYSLEVINDVNGCSLVDMVSVSSSNDFPMVSTDANGELSCIQNQVVLSGAGSSSGSTFIYKWLDDEGNEIGIEEEVEVNQEGTYTLVVENTANGCVASEDIVVVANTSEPMAIIDEPASLDCATTFVTLDGSSSDGNDLSYSWVNSAGQELGTAATLDVENSGSYSLVVTDGENGCASGTVVVTVVELPAVALDLVTTTGVICNGENSGSASVQATGGAGGFSYEWPNGSTSATQANLSSGTYLVIATDQNGCTDELMVLIDEPNALSLTVTSTNESGENLNDGMAAVEVDGGVSNYTYEWSNNSNSQNIDQLAPGVYTVTVTDANGCSVEEVINISSFDCLLQVSSSAQNVSCNGANDGSIALQIPQGAANIYNWSNGQSSASLSGLSPGVYNYTVTDFNNCDVLGSVEIIEPEELVANISNVQNITCGSGQSGIATVTSNGGSGVYSYNWSNGESTATASQLAAGNHTVIVTDENGCNIELSVNIQADDQEAPVAVAQNLIVNISANGSATITVDQINNGSSDNCGIANFSLDQNQFDCSDIGEQMVMLTVEDLSGNTNTATAMVTVVDNDLPVFDCTNDMMTNSCAPIIYTTPVATDNCSAQVELIEGMPSGSIFPVGTHTITHRATDPSGNTTLCSFEITVINDLESSVNVSDVLCYDGQTGSATVVPNGGTPGYQYLWNDGQSTANATGLSDGDYMVVVTDNTGCTTEQTVTVNQPEELIFQLDELVDDSNGQSVGAISITASGGTPTYGYTWEKDGVFYSNEEDLTGLSVGNYAIEINDANGCIVQKFGLIIDDMVPTRNFVLESQIDLMPNPTAGNLLINFELSDEHSVAMKVIDLNGKVLQTFNYGKTSLDTKTIDLSEYANGVYLLQFQLDKKQITKRIIVQH